MGRCRGPVRGPSHLCNQCAQGHRRHGFAVFVQLARTMYETVLLIIRRSWVRAPPAAPLCETVALPPPSRSCRRGFVVSGEQEDGLVGGLELRIPQGVGDCGTSRAAFSGSSARSRVPSGPSASLSSTSRLSAQLYRYRTRLGCSPANRTYPGPVGRGAHGRVPSFAWLSGGSMERGSSKAQRASRRADEAGGTGHGARDRRRPRRRMEDGRTGRQGQLEPTLRSTPGRRTTSAASDASSARPHCRATETPCDAAPRRWRHPTTSWPTWTASRRRHLPHRRRDLGRARPRPGRAAVRV